MSEVFLGRSWVTARAWERARASATAEEHARSRKLVRQSDQRRHVVGWAVVRALLAEVVGADPGALQFTRQCRHCAHPTHGKPRLKGHDHVDVSLSHAGSLVLAAVITGVDVTVGVDVEPAARDLSHLADMILSPAERQATGGGRVLQTWVRKEALLKASGVGLSVEMTSVDLQAQPRDTQVVDLMVPPSEDGSRYVAALAACNARHLTPSWRIVDVGSWPSDP